MIDRLKLSDGRKKESKSGLKVLEIIKEAAWKATKEVLKRRKAAEQETANILKVARNNAARIAAQFIQMLPDAETPEHTEGYEGFYHLIGMKGDCEEATLTWILRDHDRARFEQRKQRMQAISDYLNQVYPAGTVECVLKDSYYNMREKIEPHMEIIERAQAAFTECGVQPRIEAIRGGTDGARLSFMGLPCPNLSTGGYNFHSRKEFISVQAMETMTRVLLSLVSAK